MIMLMFLQGVNSQAGEMADQVVVVKSQRILRLMHEGEVLKEYRVALGGSPEGHKREEGDQKTPEGHYTLDYKKADSAFYRAIHISYPNAADTKQAEARGVSPGGFIMIHGQRNGYGSWGWLSRWFDWTQGCIAVTNEEMDEIWARVEAGTPIEIRP